MIREYVGFDAYEADCVRETGLLGFSPIDTALWLKIGLRDVLRGIQDGMLDLCRIVCADGSVQLVIPLCSIRKFNFPYTVERWRKRNSQRPPSWQLLMLESDRLRGAWQFGQSAPGFQSKKPHPAQLTR